MLTLSLVAARGMVSASEAGMNGGDKHERLAEDEHEGAFLSKNGATRTKIGMRRGARERGLIALKPRTRLDKVI